MGHFSKFDGKGQEEAFEAWHVRRALRPVETHKHSGVSCGGGSGCLTEGSGGRCFRDTELSCGSSRTVLRLRR